MRVGDGDDLDAGRDRFGLAFGNDDFRATRDRIGEEGETVGLRPGQSEKGIAWADLPAVCRKPVDLQVGRQRIEACATALQRLRQKLADTHQCSPDTAGWLAA